MTDREISSAADAADRGTFRVAILIVPGSSLLALAACIGPMEEANHLADGAAFTWRLLSERGGEAALGPAVGLRTEPLRSLGECDLLLVVAGRDPVLQARSALIDALIGVAPEARAICGVEGGNWVLARAGLLNGETATTRIEDLEEFADVFPEIGVVADRFTISGRYATTSGAAPVIEYMLHLIRGRFGPQLADNVAQAINYQTAPAARRLEMPAPAARLERDAPKLARAIRIMGASLDRPQDAAEIARALGLSRRALELMFRKHLGQTPMAYYLRLRLAEARRLVLETGQSAGEVAERTGFASAAAFARAFRREFGMSASALRRLHRR